MLSLRTTRRFDRDAKRMKRQAKDMTKLEGIVQTLLEGRPLQPQYRDHKLKGEWKSRRECHLEPDWLLIYKRSGDDLILERTGTTLTSSSDA